MTESLNVAESRHPKLYPILFSVIALVTGGAALACSVFNDRTHLTSCQEAIVGLFVWALCLVVVFIRTRRAGVDLRALWYSLAALALTLLGLLCISINNPESFRGFQRDAFIGAAGAGWYEEVFIRIIPLSLILLGLVPYRKFLMISTSIIFGFAHVVAHVGEWQWTSVWIGNFFLKALSTALFGLILAMVIVKAGKWGVLLTPIVHFLNDWIAYSFSPPEGSGVYLQGDNRLNYLFDIASMVIVMVIIECCRRPRNIGDLYYHFGFTPTKPAR